MWLCFMEIWNNRGHYCQETGKWLGKEPKWTMFHHLLWKSSHPKYQYEDWNIVLLDPDIHEKAHKDLDSTPKVKQLTEAAWQRHISK